MSLYQQFIGDKGKLSLPSGDIKYGFDADGDIVIAGYQVSSDRTVTIGGTAYYKLEDDKVLSRQPNFTESNGQTTIYFDNQVNANSFVEYSVDIKVADDYKTFNLVNQVSEHEITGQDLNFIDSNAYKGQTIDGQKISYENNKIIVSAGRASGARSIDLIYSSFTSVDINKAIDRSKEPTAVTINNMILKRDIDVGYINN